MGDLKTKVQGIDPNIKARDMQSIVDMTGNIYESLVVIAKRSRQINREMKIELHQKLEEFATTSDAIEEIHENKEQIEISKFYEKLPNPVIIGFEEFMGNELEYSYPLREAARELEAEKVALKEAAEKEAAAKEAAAKEAGKEAAIEAAAAKAKDA